MESGPHGGKTAQRHGDGAGHSGALHSPAGAGEGDAVPLPGGIDEEEVQHRITHIGRRIDQKWCSAVAHTPQDGGEKALKCNKGIGGGIDAQIVHRMGQDLILGPHPDGDLTAQQLIDHQSEHTADQSGQKALLGDFLGPLLIPGAHGVGDLDRIAHAQPHHGAADKPQRRTVDRHGGGAVGSHGAYHGGVHIADHGGQNTLHNSGPGQRPQHTQSPFRLFMQQCHALTLPVQTIASLSGGAKVLSPAGP